MRRKSERTASKKAKPSPEKKEKEKVKRKSTRRRKQSSSSENESVEETVPAPPTEVIEVKTDPPVTPTKQDSPEESEDQVWQVKSAGSGDGGEIQKIKICLTRPSSTPERVDRSPRSKRKHSRATSSSDTPSTEGDEKKKSKHRSKRSGEPKEESEKNQESPDEAEADTPSDALSMLPASSKEADVADTVIGQAQVSTTNQEIKGDSKTAMETEDTNKQPEDQSNQKSEGEAKDEDKTGQAATEEKPSDADTTVSSPKNEDGEKDNNEAAVQPSPSRESSPAADHSEVLELQPEDSKLCESSDLNMDESQGTEEDKIEKPENEDSSVTELVSSEVSMSENKADISEQPESNEDYKVSTNMTDVVDCSQSSKPENGENVPEKLNKDTKTSIDEESSTQKGDIPDPVKENQNGQAAPASNRKRRWGSRSSKLTSQKSITISTDILKEIIPDVKPVEFDEVVEEKKHKRVEVPDKVERPVLPKIVIDNTDSARNEPHLEDKENVKNKDVHLAASRKISIVKEEDSITVRPPSPPRHKQSNILFITNLVRPFTLLQLKNLLQRTGRIVEDGFWIDRIKSKCYVKYEHEEQAVETRHALHGVTWPVSNPKTLHVDFSTQEDFDRAKVSETSDTVPVSTIPGTVEDWLREQDMKRERGEMEKPWERKTVTREWDVGKNDKDKEAGRNLEKFPKDERLHDKRRHRSHERSPEPAKKFKKKEEEAPAKLLDDLFRKTKTTPCIYWLPLSAETIAIKEEQRRQHMAEHERRMQEMRRTHRRH